jgi:hypothetical protein
MSSRVKQELPMTIILVVMLLILVTIFATGCEPYQAITFENKNTVPVKVILYPVPQDYTGNPTRTWNDPGDVIGAGESKKFVTQVSDTRVTREKYVVIAVFETNEVALSKIFTWDELHDMDWTIVILSPE